MAEEPADFKEHGNLVQVFDTHQESEALVIQGLLSSAGIETLITALQAPQDVLPGVGGVIIRVAAEHADEARRIIADFRDNPGAEITDDSDEEQT